MEELWTIPRHFTRKAVKLTPLMDNFAIHELGYLSPIDVDIIPNSDSFEDMSASR